MVSRSSSLKKFLRTVVDQLPQYIEQYPKTDQGLLNEFRDILQKCESMPDKARIFLSKKLESYSEIIRYNENYLSLPFLWFAADYILTAKLILNVSDFHAEDYYTYLVTHLRNNSDLKGAFQLIRDQVALNDPIWESLQYTCFSPPPLNELELDCLRAVISVVKKEDLNSLNSSLIRKYIRENTSSDPPRRLNRILNPLEAKWFLWFYPPAFDLELLFIQLKLVEFESFNNIFNVNDPKNCALCMSQIFNLRNLPDSYVGVVYIPKYLNNDLIQYLHGLQQEKSIEIQELAKITDIKFSTSFALYIPDLGWRQIRNTEWSHLTHQLKNANYNFPETTSFLISSQFNQNWNFKKHTNALRAINIYLNFPRVFSVDNLLLNTSSKIEKITAREKAHLKEMYYNNVVQVTFQAERLNSAFSLDRYWIKIPQTVFHKLIHFLYYLSDCSLFLSDSKIYILTRLTQDLSSRIEKLGWEILPAIEFNIPRSRNPSWFDFDLLCWKTPSVLE